MLRFRRQSALFFGPALALCASTLPARASVSICVDVHVKSWAAGDTATSQAQKSRPTATAPAQTQTVPRNFEEARAYYQAPAATASADAASKGPSAAEAEARPRDPYTIDPASYLKRLLEYEVTHAEGFVAVPRQCAAHVVVELYTLDSGWTVFARYTMNGREEKVDRVELEEFEALAQRIAVALLQDRPISETITRDNVLEADSAQAVRTVRGRGHAALALGTAVRVGEMPTADSSEAPVREQVRVLTPFDVQLGYRLKIKSWGLDAFTRVNFGTQNTALRNNQPGGHVDYTGSGAAGLHFLRYTNGVGVNSFYFGGGAALELSLFDVIRPESSRSNSDRSWLMGGGLNVELVAGHEFLRASAVHFFAELELAIPTYAFDTENSAGSLRTYMPGGLVQVGVIL